MLVLSNSNEQTLAPGQSCTFDTVVLHTGCGECYRPNTGAVGLRAKDGIYEVSFGANIGATTAGDEAQLAINIDGSPLLETTMKSTTAAAGDLNKVSALTAVRTCCGCGNNVVTITNTGTTTVNIDVNCKLYIKRVA